MDERKYNVESIGPRIDKFLPPLLERAGFRLKWEITEASSLHPEIENPEVLVKFSGPDVELLLAEWLNALVYEMSTRRMLFSRFQPRISDGRLRATAWGEPVERERHQPAVEVKGATYTELHVGRDAAGEWIAQCVIDV